MSSLITSKLETILYPSPRFNYNYYVSFFSLSNGEGWGDGCWLCDWWLSFFSSRGLGGWGGL